MLRELAESETKLELKQQELGETAIIIPGQQLFLNAAVSHDLTDSIWKQVDGLMLLSEASSVQQQPAAPDQTDETHSLAKTNLRDCFRVEGGVLSLD